MKKAVPIISACALLISIIGLIAKIRIQVSRSEAPTDDEHRGNRI